LKDIGEGYRYVVDIDLEKFFDTVDHDVLMSRVSRRAKDKGLLGLIGRYLRCGVVVNGVTVLSLSYPSAMGRRQGVRP
jgi:RNA-directed DNA polymerase